MSNNGHIEVICEIAISDKCKGQYKITLSNATKIRKANNGKIICRFCSFKLKYSGRKNPNCKYNLNDNFFEQIDTKEKAYLLGWIASDGHIGKFGFTITIHGKDSLCLEKLRDIVCKELPIVYFYDKTYKHNNVRLKVNSNKMSVDLCYHLGISAGKKSRTVKFPLLEESLVKHFVRGYFEGDGTITNSIKSKKKVPVIGITSVSKYMLNGFKNLGITCYGNERWVYWCGKNAMQLLSNIYSETYYILDRKYERYKQWEQIYVPDRNIGENHYGAKLSEVNIIAIINEKQLGSSEYALAKKYKVSRSTINDIISGRTWKKITQKLGIAGEKKK